MRHNNFLITGFGRSGSKFLQSIMNRSRLWTVEHEPRKNRDEILCNSDLHFYHIEKAFYKDHYGEVNTYMRYNFMDVININKRGILLRDPLDVFLSVANRKDQSKLIDYIDQIDHWYTIFMHLLNTDKSIKPILFNKMTTDTNYLQDILTHFGIQDVEITEDDIKKVVNPNRSIKYESLQDLPLHIQGNAVKTLGQYKGKILTFK